MKRWTENTKPICPLSLKSGDKACYTQCLYAFKDGNNEAAEQLYGCRMGDEMDLRIDLLNRQLASLPMVPCDNVVENKPRRGRPPREVRSV